LEEAIRYLETHGDWMGNYQRGPEQGDLVRRGLVERAMALAITVRMKKEDEPRLFDTG
jgi:hypothetical protein